MIKAAGAALAALFLFSSPLLSPADAQQRRHVAGEFDHFVLSLSWSPSYCATEGAGERSIQCSRPYAFMVHGLWPQYVRGYPEFCRTRESDRVPERLVQQYLDITPSPGLIGHQWRKHGSCTGLSQAEYLSLARKAFNQVKIPQEFVLPKGPIMISPREVEQKFMSVNKGLRPDAIAVSCDRRYLREVRICFSKDLQFTRCEEVERNSCRLDRMLMPPVR